MTDNRTNNVSPALKLASSKTSTNNFFGLENLENRVMLSVANPAPTVAALSATLPAGQTTSYTLTAKNVKDNGSVASVQFYRDSNANGVLDANDRLLGEGRKSSGKNWTITGTPSDFTDGVNRFFVQATDNQGKTSAVKTTTAKFNLVSIGGLAGSSNSTNGSRSSSKTRFGGSSMEVQKNTAFTLTVVNVQNASSVEFFRDVNNNGVIDHGVDTLVGQGTQSGSTWTVADISPPTSGTVTYLVSANDIWGNASATKSITLKVL